MLEDEAGHSEAVNSEGKEQEDRSWKAILGDGGVCILKQAAKVKRTGSQGGKHLRSVWMPCKRCLRTGFLTRDLGVSLDNCWQQVTRDVPAGLGYLQRTQPVLWYGGTWKTFSWGEWCSDIGDHSAGHVEGLHLQILNSSLNLSNMFW